MTIPNDVSRCQPAGLCLRRLRCARFVADGEPEVRDPVGCEAFVLATDEESK